MFYRFNNFKIRIPSPFIDIYLFRWNELITSKIHDHAKNGCILFLLRGSIKEEIYGHQLNKVKTNIYESPSISYISNKKGFHSITPLMKSYSIHFYYPKGHKTNYYINNKDT